MPNEQAPSPLAPRSRPTRRSSRSCASASTSVARSRTTRACWPFGAGSSGGWPTSRHWRPSCTRCCTSSASHSTTTTRAPDGDRADVRVLHVVGNLDPDSGGSTSAAFHTCGYLRAHGVDTVLAGTLGEPRGAHYIRDEWPDLPVHGFP